jgi:hypothetical protein
MNEQAHQAQENQENQENQSLGLGVKIKVNVVEQPTRRFEPPIRYRIAIDSAIDSDSK